LGELLDSPPMLATLGALITVALGLLGALAPGTAARLVGLQPIGGFAIELAIGLLLLTGATAA
jgi:hypothetical protein